MKEVCYKCANCNGNTKGQQKVLGMMQECLRNFAKLKDVIADLAKLKQILYTFKVERGKADLLNRSVFYSVKKSSC